MKKVLKKYFIPHEENDYAPHILREASVTLIAGVVVLLFVVSFFPPIINNKTDLFAEIFPAVLVDLTNYDRLAGSKRTLTVNPLLEEAARRKAADMVAKGYFAHFSPEGLSPWHWMGEAGYSFTQAGENLAIFFSDSEDVEKAWMNSPGHRANILNGNFTQIGIATARGRYQGYDTTFVVEMFGNPARSSGIAASAQVISPAPPAPPAQETPRASSFAKIITAPKSFLSTIYGAIAILIAAALLFAIFIEIERQHPRHILYGCLLLILLGAAFYVRTTLLGGVFII